MSRSNLNIVLAMLITSVLAFSSSTLQAQSPFVLEVLDSDDVNEITRRQLWTNKSSSRATFDPFDNDTSDDETAYLTAQQAAEAAWESGAGLDQSYGPNPGGGGADTGWLKNHQGAYSQMIRSGNPGWYDAFFSRRDQIAEIDLSTYTTNSGYLDATFFWDVRYKVDGQFMELPEVHELSLGETNALDITFSPAWNQFPGTGIHGDIVGHGRTVVLRKQTNDFQACGIRPDLPIAPTKAPIDTVNGNKFLDFPHMYIPTPGIPLELTLMYNSKSHPSGNAWNHNYFGLIADTTSVFDGETNDWKLLVTQYATHAFKVLTNGTYATPSGSTMDLTDAAGGGYVLTLDPDVTLTFNSTGLLTKIEEGWGNSVALTYTNLAGGGATPQFTVSKAQHSNGQFLQMHHNSNGMYRVDSPSTNYHVSIGYDSNGYLSTVSRVLPSDTYTEYYVYTQAVDGSGLNLVSHTSAINDVSTWTYAENSSGDLTSRGASSQVGDDNYFETYVSYPDSNENIRYVDEVVRGTTNRYTYYIHPVFEKVESIVGPEVAGQQNSVELRFEFDDSGNRTNVFQADWSAMEWMKTAFHFNDEQLPTNMGFGYLQEPAAFWEFTWDSDFDALASITDPEGRVIEFEYTNGSVSLVSLIVDSTTSYDTVYTYTTNGLLASVTNANGHYVDYTYDSLGFPDIITPQVGPTVDLDYNNLGHIVEMTFPGEVGTRTVAISPDSLGRITSIDYPNGLSETFSYDGVDNLLTNIDTAGRATVYTYEPQNVLSSVTRFLGSATGDIPVTVSFAYDQLFNSLSVTDSLNREVESYRLDAQHRPAEITNLESQVMTVGFGIHEYVNTITRFDESEVAFDYDGNGRVGSIVYADDTLEFGYFDNDLLHTAENGLTLVSNEYNSVNRLTKSDSTHALVADTSSVSYTYYPAGQVSNVVHIADDVTYSYDAAERVTQIDSSAAGQINYTYNTNNGLVQTMSYPNGIICTYSYDGVDRVNGISYETTDALVYALAYDYDNAGMITNLDLTAGSLSESTQYEYDELDRLVSETRRNYDGEIVDQSAYTYDLAGNRLTKTRNGVEVSYEYGIGNRMTNWSAQASSSSQVPIQVSGYANEAIGTDPRFGQRSVNDQAADSSGTNYWAEQVLMDLGTQDVVAAIGDLAGNVGFATNEVVLSLATNRGYSYDLAGNVTNIECSAGLHTKSLKWSSQYRLEAVSKTGVVEEAYSYDALGRWFSTVTGSSTNFHLFDGIQCVADIDHTGAVVRGTLHGPGIDNVLSITTYSSVETNSFYYLTDHLGSVIAITDDQGEVVEQYRYDAWGRVSVFDEVGAPLTESAIGNSYTFQGRQHSWATGLTHFRARWYDPITGRWLSKDPIRIRGGLNLYAAFVNSPVMYTDPLGLLNPNAAAELKVYYSDASDAAYGYINGLIDWFDLLPDRSNDPEFEIGKKGGQVVDVALAATGLYKLGQELLRRGFRRATQKAVVQGCDEGGKLAKILLREDDALLGIVKDGKLISHTPDIALSHKDFAKRAGVLVGDSLDEGVQLITFGKYNGQVIVRNSQTFAKNQGPAGDVATKAVKDLFE